VTRIVAGELRGRRLTAPPGARTRPTSDRVREALFNTLESMTSLAGSRFADLYAGSGAVGLEAYSRGAGHVLLVESDPRAARAVRANIAALAADVRLVTHTVESVLAAGPDGDPYDIVFADPPYTLPPARIDAVLRAVAGGWLAPGAVVVIERSRRSPPLSWMEPVTAVAARRYGETSLWYGRRP
jgi:16S rRNA (guanine966-N2)-methyltransferase